MIAFLVAIPFAISALTKSIDSGFFLRQIGRTTSLPQVLIPIVALIVLALNCFLVMALVLNNCGFITRPLGIGYLAIASVLSLTHWFAHKRPSCGCYGPALNVHPLLSISINVTCIALLCYLPNSTCTHQSLQYILIFMLLGVIIGRQSIHKPLIDLSVTAEGKTWTKGAKAPLQIVAFLSPQCSSCQTWISALNVLSKQHPVVVVSYSEINSLTPSIIRQHQSRRAILREIEYFPTILLIKKQLIVKRWVEKSPQNILEEMSLFY